MKAFVAVALAAAAQAAPEADPQVLLAQPLVYGNAHTQVEAQVQHANGAVVPGETLSVKAAKAQHLTAKANAYLNKPLVYTAPVVNTPVVHQTLPVVHQTVASPVVSYTGAYPHVFGTRFIKREADAEAQPEAEADPALLIPGTYYNGVCANGVCSGANVVGAHHLVNPVVTYTNGLTTPVVSTPVVNTVATKAVVPTTVVKSVVPTAVVKAPVFYNYGVHTPLTTGYTGYGYSHLIKREADAEAEADPLTVVNPYTGVYRAGLYGAHQLVNPMSAFHHIPAVVNQVVNPVTYTHGLTTPVVNTVATKTVVHPLYDTTHVVHLGKREAEAEADPEAYFYGNYYNAAPAYTTGLRTYAYNRPVYGYTGYNLGYNGLYY